MQSLPPQIIKDLDAQGQKAEECNQRLAKALADHMITKAKNSTAKTQQTARDLEKSHIAVSKARREADLTIAGYLEIIERIEQVRPEAGPPIRAAFQEMYNFHNRHVDIWM